MSWFEDVGDVLGDLVTEIAEADWELIGDVAKGSLAGAGLGAAAYVAGEKVYDSVQKTKDDGRKEITRQLDEFKAKTKLDMEAKLADYTSRVLNKKYIRRDKNGKRIWMDDDEFSIWKAKEDKRRRDKIEAYRRELDRERTKAISDKAEELKALSIKNNYETENKEDNTVTWKKFLGGVLIIGATILGGAAVVSKQKKA